MAETSDAGQKKTMIKVVYFDEESASDYLDISAGGKPAATSENVKDRTTNLHSEVETRLGGEVQLAALAGRLRGNRRRRRHLKCRAEHPPQDAVQHDPDGLPPEGRGGPSRATAAGSSRVRKLGKLVDEVISLVLVRAILSDVPATDTPNTKDAA